MKKIIFSAALFVAAIGFANAQSEGTAKKCDKAKTEQCDKTPIKFKDAEPKNASDGCRLPTTRNAHNTRKTNNITQNTSQPQILRRQTDCI